LVTSARNLSEVSILSIKLKIGDQGTDGLNVSDACDIGSGVRFVIGSHGVEGTSINILFIITC